MKTFNRTSLPDSIEYNGKTYTVNMELSNAMRHNNTSPSFMSRELKKAQNSGTVGRSMILVNVLSKNLKGRTDLHGKEYQPTKWIFTNN